MLRAVRGSPAHCSDENIRKAEGVLVETGLQACNTCCHFPVGASIVALSAVQQSCWGAGFVHLFPMQSSFIGLLPFSKQPGTCQLGNCNTGAYDLTRLWIDAYSWQEAATPIAQAQSEAGLLQRDLEALQDRWQKARVGLLQPSTRFRYMLRDGRDTGACLPFLCGLRSLPPFLSRCLVTDHTLNSPHASFLFLGDRAVMAVRERTEEVFVDPQCWSSFADFRCTPELIRCASAHLY